MTNERLCIVIPVYNEEAAIGTVLAKWSAELDRLGIDYTIRPYNDGSKDSSLTVLRTAAFRDAFFIPSLILATTAAFRRGKGLCITLLCCGATLFIARQAKTCESSANARANRDLCRTFVRECARLIPSGSDVVVAADLDEQHRILLSAGQSRRPCLVPRARNAHRTNGRGEV